jgi:hypothetical protein
VWTGCVLHDCASAGGFDLVVRSMIRLLDMIRLDFFRNWMHSAVFRCSFAAGRLGISQFCASICSIRPIDFGVQRCGLSLDRVGSGLFQIRSRASHNAAD